MNRRRKQQEAHVLVSVRSRDGVLFVRRVKSGVVYWSLPAGKIELHETPQVALKRIVWSQTGLVVEPESVGKKVHSEVISGRAKSTHRLTTLFHARKTGGALRPGETKFFKTSDLAKTRLNERSRLAVAAL